jgi:hypothetical protein
MRYLLAIILLVLVASCAGCAGYENDPRTTGQVIADIFSGAGAGGMGTYPQWQAARTGQPLPPPAAPMPTYQGGVVPREGLPLPPPPTCVGQWDRWGNCRGTLYAQ